MADELRTLMQEQDYLKERLADISAERARLLTEGAQLKEELNNNPEPDRIKAIKRRRVYLKRRADELKAERSSKRAERETVIAQVDDLKKANR